MVKILTIEKKGNKYIVCTNKNEYKFTEDVIIKYIITKNKEYTIEDFNEIVSFSKKSEFYNKVLNFLSYKDRSVKEVREYLVSKDCAITEEIIDDLISKKLLDDYRYANSYLESCNNNLKGPFYLKKELTNKGIDEATINEVLSNYNYNLITDNLNLLIDKELRKEKLVSFNKYKNQLTTKFLRLGFKLNDINQVINDRKNELLDVIDELSSLEKEYSKLETKNLSKDKLIAKLISKGFKYTDILDVVSNYSK
ncbi:RecX family transcriptional regulator [Mycoplasmatota bacterium WC44]